jgi:membrane fusion protein, heavy metal efflux system
MKKKLLYTGWLLFLFSCSSKKEATPESGKEKDANTVTLTPAQLKNAMLDTGKISGDTISRQLHVNGVVDVPPQNIVSVSFPLGGYLRSTKLMPGMHVSRGETIGVIEDPALIQLQQDYLIATTRLTYLQQEYDRQKMLNENKVNADKLYQQAQADLSAQRVLVKGYREKLLLIGISPDRLTEQSISRSVAIHSPINGFVSKVNVNIGKYVTATDVLFELINPDDMHAMLTVFEKDITSVKIGQRVQVSFVDEPGRMFECEVILVSKNVNDDRGALVHCHFEQQPENLLPGMFLNAAIHVNNQPAMMLPEEAVVRYGNKHYVFEANGEGRFTMLEVQTGFKENGRVVISSEDNDFAARTLVIRNAYTLLSKMKNTSE